MTRFGLWADRVRNAWDSPSTRALRRGTGLLAGVLWRLLVMLLLELRPLWARLSGRVRVGIVLIALVLVASGTETAAPSLSATAQGLAVLLVAGIGFWIMLARPHWRRS